MSGIKTLLTSNLAATPLTEGAVNVLTVLLHTFSAGMILALSTFLLDTVISRKSLNSEMSLVSRLISAANQLIMCIGVGGMMLLIEQNLVRAVVLFAALALVRFRVRVSEKSLSSSFFFSVISGMAIGMGQTGLAWIFTGVFFVLSLILSISFWTIVPPQHSEAEFKFSSTTSLNQ